MADKSNDAETWELLCEVSDLRRDLTKMTFLYNEAMDRAHKAELKIKNPLLWSDGITIKQVRDAEIEKYKEVLRFALKALEAVYGNGNDNDNGMLYSYDEEPKVIEAIAKINSIL